MPAAAFCLHWREVRAELVNLVLPHGARLIREYAIKRFATVHTLDNGPQLVGDGYFLYPTGLCASSQAIRQDDDRPAFYFSDVAPGQSLKLRAPHGGVKCKCNLQIDTIVRSGPVGKISCLSLCETPHSRSSQLCRLTISVSCFCLPRPLGLFLC